MEQSVYDQYELVVGLEVHMQLKTASKAYASDANLFGALPNTLVSPITLGHPGTLPKVNTQSVDFAIKLALATNMQINTPVFSHVRIISTPIYQRVIKLHKTKLLSAPVVKSLFVKTMVQRNALELHGRT